MSWPTIARQVGHAFDVYSCDIHRYDAENDLLTYLAFWDLELDRGEGPWVCEPRHQVSQQVTGEPFHPDLRPASCRPCMKGKMIEVHRDDPDLHRPRPAMAPLERKPPSTRRSSSTARSSACSVSSRRVPAAFHRRREGAVLAGRGPGRDRRSATPTCSSGSISRTVRCSRSSRRAVP